MTTPLGLQYKKVVGRFRDIYTDPATGEQRDRPTEGQVYITPSIKNIKRQISDTEDVLVNLDAHTPSRIQMANGTFEADLIVCDQPGISPQRWSYNIKTSWTDLEANIMITSDSPDTIEVDDFFYIAPTDGVIVTQGDPGRGVEDITAVGTTATVNYSDGTTSSFELPLGNAENIKLYYEHIQDSPSDEWIVQHNLHRPVNFVRVKRGEPGSSEHNDLYLCPWEEIDNDTLKIFLASAASGRAVIS